MCVTEKKLKANRQNALKHGLLVRVYILHSSHIAEDREEKSWEPSKSE